MPFKNPENTDDEQQAKEVWHLLYLNEETGEWSLDRSMGSFPTHEDAVEFLRTDGRVAPGKYAPMKSISTAYDVQKKQTVMNVVTEFNI